jgi:hypothetical protein
MEFQIDIKEKVARVIGTPVIVCGNSDYTIRFTFDAEWLDKVVKTARFVWVKNGETQYEEVPFTDSTVAVPKLSNITAVQVGVYAGELQTTTPARVPCVRSILCGGGEQHPEPPADVYTQLLKLLEGLTVQSPITVAVEERNTGAPFSFWCGSQVDYDAIPEEQIAKDCLYVIKGPNGVASYVLNAKYADKAGTVDKAIRANHADTAGTATNATRYTNCEGLLTQTGESGDVYADGAGLYLVVLIHQTAGTPSSHLVSLVSDGGYWSIEDTGAPIIVGGGASDPCFLPNDSKYKTAWARKLFSYPSDD